MQAILLFLNTNPHTQKLEHNIIQGVSGNKELTVNSKPTHKHKLTLKSAQL